MPTPRDSTEELPLHLEPSSHSSCPPEFDDRPARWSQQVLGDMEHAIADVANHPESSRRIPGVTPSISGLNSRMVVYEDSRREKGIEHAQPDLTAEITPPLSAASPQSSNEDEKELARIPASTVASSPADLTFSTAYGIDSPRV